MIRIRPPKIIRLAFFSKRSAGMSFPRFSLKMTRDFNKTKRQAIVTAIQEFNRRKRMAELIKHAGTCKDLISVEDLSQQRRKG